MFISSLDLSITGKRTIRVMNKQRCYLVLPPNENAKVVTENSDCGCFIQAADAMKTNRSIGFSHKNHKKYL